MTRKRTRTLIIVGCVLAGLTTGYLGLALLAHVHGTQFGEARFQEHLAEVERHFEAIKKDLVLIDANPIFPTWSREKNAEPFLSKYVTWGSDTKSTPPWSDHAKLLAIVERYKNVKDIEQWKRFESDPEVLSLDVSWVDELKNFDHWSFLSTDAYRRIIEDGPKKNSIARIGMWSSSPFPEMQELRWATLARFAQLHSKGETMLGFENVRKSAELFHSTSTLIGGMMAVFMLHQEVQLMEHTGFAGWVRIDEDRIMAYRRLAWGWAGLVHLFQWKPEHVAEFEPYIKPSNGICGGTWENVLAGSFYGDFLEGHVPLESDYTARIANVREVTGKFLDRCQLSELKALGLPTPAGARGLFSEKAEQVWSASGEPLRIPLNPSRVPFVRRVVGFTLFTIAMPGWMRQYQEREVASETQPAE